MATAGAGDAPADADGSPATVDVHAGFCVVNLTPRTLERFVGATEDAEYRQDALWVAVARQVGRCVDVSRDEHGTQPPATPHSIAPIDSGRISSTHDYFLATQRPATRKWRDGFADAFAIGWMRLAKPEYASRLANTLRHDRETPAAEGDEVESSCTISSAMRVPAPPNLEALVEWADHVRTSACGH